MKIFKKSILSFFRDMPAIVYVMAFVFFGATLFVALTVQGMVQGVSEFGKGLQVILQDESVALQVQVGDLKGLFDQEDVVNAYRQALERIAASFQDRGPEVTSKINALTERAMQTMLLHFGIGFAILALGFFLGSFFCARDIKVRHGIKRGILRSLLGWLLGSVVFAAMISGATYLLERFPWTGAISGIVIAILQSFFALLKAGILQNGFKKGLKGVSFLDILRFILINVVLYLVSFFIAYGLIAISRSVALGFIIALPLLIYVKDFMGVYASIYIVQKDDLAAKA